ncbi:MAG: PAS domain S-box protein [Planctomycetes bacterium]|nr:PAS domain S-box protein [Planctomycetota bacterium]
MTRGTRPDERSRRDDDTSAVRLRAPTPGLLRFLGFLAVLVLVTTFYLFLIPGIGGVVRVSPWVILAFGCALAALLVHGMVMGTRLRRLTTLALDRRQRLETALREERAARTELKSTKAELERSLARLRGFVETAADAIVVIDSAGTIVFVNPAIEGLFEQPADEFVGRNVSMLMPSPFREQHDGYLARHFEQGTSTLIGGSRELRAVTATGREFPIKLSLGRFEVDGEVWFTGIIHDISELKEIEGELRRSNEELLQFAAVASHDLQEPVRMVSSFLGLIAERLDGRLDEDEVTYFRFALDGAERMRGMIQGLLRFSRVDRKTTMVERVDLAEIARSSRADLQLAIEDAGATVTIGDLPTIRGDRVLLGSVFENLIGNAIKYVARGQAPVVTVSGRDERHRVIVEVADNGIGIAPEFRERIFHLFQRLHGRDEYPGLGIGLALVLKIVEAHRGSIEIDDQPGGGSIFRLVFPRPEGYGSRGEETGRRERLTEIEA